MRDAELIAVMATILAAPSFGKGICAATDEECVERAWSLLQAAEKRLDKPYDFMLQKKETTL